MNLIAGIVLGFAAGKVVLLIIMVFFSDQWWAMLEALEFWLYERGI